jgi:hypothetical protein
MLFGQLLQVFHFSDDDIFLLMKHLFLFFRSFHEFEQAHLILLA